MPVDAVLHRKEVSESKKSPGVPISETSINSQAEVPRVSIEPLEDARLPILEAQIEREWREYRKAYVNELLRNDKLKSQVRETALWCLHVLRQYEERGLGADQAREAMRPLIHPQWDCS